MLLVMGSDPLSHQLWLKRVVCVGQLSSVSVQLMRSTSCGGLESTECVELLQPMATLARPLFAGYQATPTHQRPQGLPLLPSQGSRAVWGRPVRQLRERVGEELRCAADAPTNGSMHTASSSFSPLSSCSPSSRSSCCAWASEACSVLLQVGYLRSRVDGWQVRP